jgi:hypothetical protein
MHPKSRTKNGWLSTPIDNHQQHRHHRHTGGPIILRQSHWTTIPLDDSPFGPGNMEEEGEGVGNDNPSANNASTIRLLIFCLPYLAVYLHIQTPLENFP